MTINRLGMVGCVESRRGECVVWGKAVNPGGVLSSPVERADCHKLAREKDVRSCGEGRMAVVLFEKPIFFDNQQACR